MRHNAIFEKLRIKAPDQDSLGFADARTDIIEPRNERYRKDGWAKELYKQLRGRLEWWRTRI